MLKQAFITIFVVISFSAVYGQDSVWVRLRPKYERVSSIHRLFFGENYRKEWADSTRLPVIDLALVGGGLKPLRLGGGHQTVSLRLASPDGKEWVLRNIEKDASVLLPLEVRQTFAKDIIDDAMSAQHPFSPLVVAELANAAGVPHAVPIIGVVKSSPVLAEFNKQFAGRVCLLEEREPMGKSENSARMLRDLIEDNDNSIDAEAFMRARLLDLLIGDWDRHPDQWRWVDSRKGKTKYYVGIPRDRDQAFYVNQGLFPRLASRPWFVPSLQGFRKEIWFPKYSLKESSFMHAWPSMHMPLQKWMAITNAFTSSLSDEVIRKALKKLPSPAYERRHEQLFDALRQRRDNIPSAIEEYFRFVNRIAEVRLSNKHELISISDTANSMMRLQVNKSAKQKHGAIVLDALYDPATTKELRIFAGGGNDSFNLHIRRSPIRIRIIGGEGNKTYNVLSSPKRVRIYEDDNNVRALGRLDKLKLLVNDDSMHTAYTPVNRYNIVKPLVTGGFNRDDGFLLGMGIQVTHQGFRKLPYAGLNRIMLHHSFATSAFRLRYAGEFIHAVGKADMVATADIFAPENTQNFFGRGNETIFNKTGDHITFYRARFSTYNVVAGLRWRTKNGWNFYAAPAFQHYRFDSAHNRGRILNIAGSVKSYDSSSVAMSKSHAGIVLSTGINKRNGRIIPTSGYLLNVKVQSFAGISGFAKSFTQLIPEFVGYLPLNRKRTVVVAERLGGGISAGKPAFYQSMFAGGHENLLGFRQYRFAGEHMLYNNLELRMKLANFTGYIIPGEFGLLGFYDVGRVWTSGENSNKFHHGSGGGLYFAPAKMAVISIVAGNSKEGWYPYITFGFRY